MKKIILLIFSLCMTVMLHAITVNSTAGGLSTAITNAGGNLSTVTSLTVTGVIDARDFKIMRDQMPVLSSLDLSEVTIAAYTGTGGTNNPLNETWSYAANHIPIKAFSDCETLTSITLPSSVTSIEALAFYYCEGLTSISIPSSVTSIGIYAFSGCFSLTSIIFPSSLTSIGKYVFWGCEGLTSIRIPSSVTSIGEGAFLSCTGLTSIRIPSSVTYIGEDAFRDCRGLTSINIPSSVTSIGEGAFLSCTGLTSISIPSSVTSIESFTFMYCEGLSSINIPSSVTSIGDGAFSSCTGLTSISIPLSVTSIGEYAFSSCNALTSINIPSSVTSIGDGAFSSCLLLTSVSIPASLISLGDCVFSYSENIRSIYVYATTPLDLGNNEYFLYGIDKTTCTLYVPKNSFFLYRSAYQWRDFNNVKEMWGAGVSREEVDLLSIYPNPATDGFSVSGLNAISTLSVLDLNGKTLLTQQVSANDYISISSLPKGLYVLKISNSKNEFINKKLIKE